MQECVLQEGVLHEGVLHEGVMQEGVLQESALCVEGESRHPTRRTCGRNAAPEQRTRLDASRPEPLNEGESLHTHTQQSSPRTSWRKPATEPRRGYLQIKNIGPLHTAAVSRAIAALLLFARCSKSAVGSASVKNVLRPNRLLRDIFFRSNN